MVSGLISLIVPAVSVDLTVLTVVMVCCWAKTPHGKTKMVNAMMYDFNVFMIFSL
jgi:hypothetical protein